MYTSTFFILLFLSLFIWNKTSKRVIYTETTIAAKPEKVWNTIIDFEKYGHWNPFITSIEGEPAVGKSIRVTLQLPQKKPMVMKPIVLKNCPLKVFEWKGSLGFQGIFDGTHSFELIETDTGSTRFIHREKFTGICSALVLQLIEKDTAAGFKAMNVALKEKVEKEYD